MAQINVARLLQYCQANFACGDIMVVEKATKSGIFKSIYKVDSFRLDETNDTCVCHTQIAIEPNGKIYFDKDFKVINARKPTKDEIKQVQVLTDNKTHKNGFLNFLKKIFN